jgi:hypothetical protein
MAAPLAALAAKPLAAVLGPLLSGFAGWLAKFLGSWLMMGLFALLAEGLPRLLGLGQGLISWGFGVAASAAFSAFQSAMSMAGVEVPSLSALLAGLPPGVLWLGSVLRVHKVAYILVSILIVRLLRKVAEAAAASAAKASSASLIMGGR